MRRPCIKLPGLGSCDKQIAAWSTQWTARSKSGDPGLGRSCRASAVWQPIDGLRNQVEHELIGQEHDQTQYGAQGHQLSQRKQGAL